MDYQMTWGESMSKKLCRRIMMMLLCILLVGGSLATSAAAAGGIENAGAFENMTGDEKYVAEKYRDNYALDIEETGLFDIIDSVMNSIANVLFTLISLLGALVVNVFYRAMDFDFSLLFANQINGIQAALKSSIFDAFFILALCGAFVILVKKMARRDLAGMITETGKIIMIIVFSFAVVSNSAVALSSATKITKSISTAALMDINNQGGGSSVTDYAAASSGLIWKSLVHDPWVTLQFGATTPDTADIDTFLTTQPSTDTRKTLIKDYQQAHKNEDNTVFSKGLGLGRIGFLVVYLIPFLVKSALYMLLAALQIAYQLMAVFYVLLAPVILLLSMLPCFGIDMITNWLKKIFETQLMILILTFLIGLVLKLDSLLYSMSGQYGWLVVIFLETLVAVVVVMNYKSILGGISKINKTVRQPTAAKYALQRSGNAAEMSGAAFHTLGRGARNLSSKARMVTTRFRNRERLEYSEEDYLDDDAADGEDTATGYGGTYKRRKRPSGSQSRWQGAPGAPRTEAAEDHEGEEDAANTAWTRRRYSDGGAEQRAHVPRPTAAPQKGDSHALGAEVKASGSGTPQKAVARPTAEKPVTGGMTYGTGKKRDVTPATVGYQLYTTGDMEESSPADMMRPSVPSDGLQGDSRNIVPREVKPEQKAGEVHSSVTRPPVAQEAAPAAIRTAPPPAPARTGAKLGHGAADTADETPGTSRPVAAPEITPDTSRTASTSLPPRMGDRPGQVAVGDAGVIPGTARPSTPPTIAPVANHRTSPHVSAHSEAKPDRKAAKAVGRAPSGIRPAAAQNMTSEAKRTLTPAPAPAEAKMGQRAAEAARSVARPAAAPTMPPEAGAAVLTPVPGKAPVKAEKPKAMDPGKGKQLKPSEVGRERE